jgi:hypothetical protein
MRTAKPDSFRYHTDRLGGIFSNDGFIPVMKLASSFLDDLEQDIVGRDDVAWYWVCEWIARSEVELDQGLRLGRGPFERAVETFLAAEIADS